MVRVPPKQVQFSRQLRRDMTDAEQLLWRHLRMRQLDGHKFRRQHVLENYVLDFVCLEAKLVIELDGGQHAENTEYDDLRTKEIEKHGLRILRFWNNDVLSNIESVMETIRAALDAAPNPHPILPPERGKV